MRISALKNNKITFKSIRTDKKRVAQLKQGETPIIENNRRNILASLANLSKETDKTNIEFLLDIAENLAYGQGGEDSAFSEELGKDGYTPSKRENIDWQEALKSTISIALASSSEDVEELNARFDKVFAKGKELTPEQQKLLDLRKNLISKIASDSALEDDETLTRTATSLKNLDYFVASSEIPAKQKTDVLNKLIHFMSDDYKINPQLKDKKHQVLDEILNDIVIKTPESDILKIKAVDQRESGICAAISICRKLMAYEDKTRYVELIMDELQDSPKMTVFDITELGSGKTVEIPKPEIEYATGLKKGYRIIDTSAHLWMHNAHSSGDGSIQTEAYIAFDDENYGVFNDSSWYLGLDEELMPEKLLLIALIKEREALKAFQKTKKQYSEAQRNITTVKKEALTTQSAARGGLNQVLVKAFPSKNNAELNSLLNSLIKFYSGSKDSNEVNVPAQFSKEDKADILTKFIIESVPEITEEQKSIIKENGIKIYQLTHEYVQADSRIEKLQAYNSPRGKYVYNKQLFKLAASHRIAMEADVNTPKATIRWEKGLLLPTRDKQISNFLSSIDIGNDKKKQSELLADTIKVNSTIPSELNSICELLFDDSVQQLTSRIFANIANNIQNGDSRTLAYSKEMLGMENKSKSDVIQRLNQISEKISKSNTLEETYEGIRTLGYEDMIQFVGTTMHEYYSQLLQGISEEEANSLADKFGGFEKIQTGLEAQREKFQTLQEQYSEILEKWNVPSSKTLILDKLEKKYGLVSRKKLDKLQHRFDTIQAGVIANEKIENSKARTRANNKLYKFTPDEEEIFAQIEKNVASMKKYSKLNYLSVNKALFEELEKQYSNIGMLNGQFWVREEGSSGLSANEQLRIVEQMTGKPYHIEYDAKDAAKQIKEGTTSGIISLSVLDDDYGFHAQYVPAVTPETDTDKKTKEQVVKDVLWTDNSWGNSERHYFWNGKDGLVRTDYGNGYGWSDGFISDSEHKIGLPVDDIHGALGVARKYDDDKFGLFTDVLLEGTPIDTYQKLLKTFNYILNLDELSSCLSGLESIITSGYKFNIKELENVDEYANIKTDRILKRAEKEINSEEEYNKLPKDDELRFAFDKIAVFMLSNDPSIADTVLPIDNPEDLEKAIQNIYQESAESLGALFAKSDKNLDTIYNTTVETFIGLFEELKTKFAIDIDDKKQAEMVSSIIYDTESLKKNNGSLTDLTNSLLNRVVQVTMENIENEDAQYFFISNAQKAIADSIENNVRIKSLDDPILVNSPLGKTLINAIDKHLNPKSDKELLDYIQGLQHIPYEEADKFLDLLSPEDVGLKVKSGYEYLKLYKAGNSAIYKALSESIASQEISKNMHVSDDPQSATAEELFRGMYIRLSEMDVQKYIKAFKAEAFQKYKVRQAFPEPKVLEDKDITEYLARNLIEIRKAVIAINEFEKAKDIFQTFNKLIANFESNEYAQAIKNRKDVTVTSDNIENIRMVVGELIDLYSTTVSDQTKPATNDKIETLINTLLASIEEVDFGKSKTAIINGKKAGQLLNGIFADFDNFEKAGHSVGALSQKKKEYMQSLKNQLNFLVTTNIEPKYRDMAKQTFNKLITAYRKDMPEDVINEIEEEVDAIFIDKHIVKSPTILLRETTKLLMEGKQNTNEYKGLRLYLESALRIAQQTKIQYKLVQNQHDGISAKTKSMLGLFSVTDINGKKHSMDSEMGMVYLVERLRNNSDNHVTLNLFLEQSGLSKKALVSLIHNIDLVDAKADIEERVVEIKEHISKLDEITQKAEGYFAKVKTKPATWKQAVEDFSNYMQRVLAKYKEDSLFKHYIDCVNAIKNMDCYDNQSKEMLNNILHEGNNEALYQTSEAINREIDEIQECKNLLINRGSLISTIRVPQECNESKERQKFYEEYEDVLTFIDTELNTIRVLINESDALSTINNY